MISGRHQTAGVAAGPATAPKKPRRRFVFRKREKPLSRWTVAGFVLVYFPVALAISAFDSGFLLMAWLFAGPFVIAVWYSRDIKEPVVNGYTIFFLTMIIANLAGYAATHYPR
jgi:hypothetical protein